jgi:hypothetical protein
MYLLKERCKGTRKEIEKKVYKLIKLLMERKIISLGLFTTI